MKHLYVNLRTAWKLTRRAPSAMLMVFILLVLGTGGVSTVFYSIYSLVLADLPFPKSDRLVVIGGNILLFNGFSSRFVEKEALGNLFSNLTAYAPFPSTKIVIPDAGKYKEVLALEVTESFFETLGVRPLPGHDFLNIADRPAIIISNRFWVNELNQENNVIGMLVHVNNDIAPIIGIMPDEFDFISGTDIWLCRGTIGWRFSSSTQFLGRLHPGISMEQAVRELKVMKFDSPARDGWIGKDGPTLQSLKNIYYGDRSQSFLMLSVTSVLFFMLICSGVISIFITHGVKRKSEMIMRLILGASRRNLVFQLMCETLPIIIIGTGMGLWLSRIVRMWLLIQFPTLQGGEVDVFIKMMFFVILIFVTSIMASLVPALYISDVNLNINLKSDAILKRRVFSLQETITGIQLGLALALLIGVGVLLRGMMSKVDLPIELTSHEIDIVGVQFPQESLSFSIEIINHRTNILREFQQQLEAMPEVVSSGVLNPIPFSEDAVRESQRPVNLYKSQSAGPGTNEVAHNSIQGYASPEGFKLLGISLVSGRFFSFSDIAKEFDIKRKAWTSDGGSYAGGVVIINRSLAKQFWPQEDAVGKTIYDTTLNSHEIVGVVQDFHQVADNKKFIPTMYFPAENANVNQKFLVKLRSDALRKSFRQRLFKMDKSSMYINIQSLGDSILKSTVNTRLLLHLLGGFALLGCLISGLSVWATTTAMAASRTRETGIRMALGAKIGDIFKLVLWRGTRAILIGLPFGLFFAWILSRILSSFIFQLNPNDPFAWAISCILLIGIVFVAALIPALRTSRVNLMNALKKE